MFYSLKIKVQLTHQNHIPAFVCYTLSLSSVLNVLYTVPKNTNIKKGSESPVLVSDLYFLTYHSINKFFAFLDVLPSLKLARYSF